MGAVEADARRVVVPGVLLLGDRPVVGRLHARGRALDPVAAERPAAGAAGVEAQDEPVLELDELEVAGPLGTDEVAAHRLARHEHQRLERLVPRVLVDVELLVPPHEQRQQHAVVHLADRRLAELLEHQRHERVRVVDVAVVALAPRLLRDVQSSARAAASGCSR